MTRSFRLAALFLVVLSIAFAASPVCPGISQREAVPYRGGQLFDAFVPPGRPQPAVIVIHGSSGNRRTHVNQVLQVIEKSGRAWFSLDYRNIDDIRAAINFIGCPGRFNIQGKPVLIGEDKGAELALSVANANTASAIVAFGTTNPTSIKQPTIPVLMFHGESDEESPIAPVQSLCTSWRSCTLIAIPHGIHNLENWHPDQWSWKEDLEALLRSDRRGLWKDIAYSMPDGRPLLMDAFLPQGVGPFPAVIVVHGGGWEAGDKQTYISPILDVLTRSGFAWFSIDYRLTPYVRNDDQLEDVRNAIRYVRLHADRFHVFPNSLSVLGESAGGQIVTQLASLPCPGCSPNSVVSLYGVYDFTQFTKDADGRRMLDRIFGKWTTPVLEAASPLNHISSSLPPLLLLQGTNDELYAGSLAYHEVLKAQNIAHKLVVLQDAPHGMENWTTHPDWVKSLEDIALWLRQQSH